jgi:dihydrofolate reductase
MAMRIGRADLFGWECHMVITMIMVMSLDGIVGKPGTSVADWASAEDQRHLHSIMERFEAVVCGRKSFEGRMFPGEYFVLTNNEALLQGEAEAHVTYVNGGAKRICALLQERGYEHIALLGGPTVNYLFLKEHLVDDLYLTIEGKMFGQGTSFHIQEELDCRLTLDYIEQLNSKGTLLLHYFFDK